MRVWSKEGGGKRNKLKLPVYERRRKKKKEGDGEDPTDSVESREGERKKILEEVERRSRDKVKEWNAG